MTDRSAVCWIDTIDDAEANPELQSIYATVRNPDGSLDNLYRAFSLTPHTITPADDLYRAALHHPHNTLEKWFSELLGCLVAHLSGCDYALTHHGHNFRHLYPPGDQQAETLLRALRDGRYDACGNRAETLALQFVERLTLTPEQMSAAAIDQLRVAGWSDGEISEIVQVVGMFSYFVRVINALGISLAGDRIGLYSPD